MQNDTLTALKTAKAEYEKILEKYKKKAEKERAKINDIYVLVCGEKCYSENEINEWYASDYITCEQSDKYIEKLNKKRRVAGDTDNLTKSERVCQIIRNTVMSLSTEIAEIEKAEEEKKKKQERWEIAQMQGCSYKEFLELEETSRRSIEYEQLMGV